MIKNITTVEKGDCCVFFMTNLKPIKFIVLNQCQEDYIYPEKVCTVLAQVIEEDRQIFNLRFFVNSNVTVFATTNTITL